MLDLLGAAHAAVAPQDHGEGEIALAEVERLAGRLGWRPELGELERLADVARALDALRAAGFELPPDVMIAYLEGMRTIAAAEIAAVPAGPDEAVRYVVLGTTLAEPFLLALRRLAEEIAAAQRFPPGSGIRDAEPYLLD